VSSSGGGTAGVATDVAAAVAVAAAAAAAAAAGIPVSRLMMSCIGHCTCSQSCCSRGACNGNR